MSFEICLIIRYIHDFLFINSVLYDDLTRETTNPGSFGHETKRFKGTEIILVEDDDENDVIYDGNFEFKNEGSDLCCICLDNNVNSVLVPCGHLTLCYGCAELHSKEKQNRCPICRSKVDFFIKTYKS